MAAMASPRPLRIVDLSGCTLLSTGVEVLGDSCPFLHTLNLQGCVHVSAANLQAVLSRCPIQSLNLNDIDAGDMMVDAVANYCPDLVELRLAEAQLSDASLQRIGRNCSRLQCLELVGGGTSRRGLASLFPRLTELRSLRLSAYVIVTPGLCKAVANCRGLRSLDLSECPIIYETMVSVATLPHLQSLNLSGNSLFDDFAKPIGTIGTLKRLDVSSATIRDAFFYELFAPGLVQLSVLDVSECVGVTIRGLKAVANACPSVRVCLSKSNFETKQLKEVFDKNPGSQVFDRGRKKLLRF